KIDVNLLFKLTNEERMKNNLEAAQKYVEYLARNKIYDHVPNARKKIPGIIWVDNLARECKNEEDAIKSWMNSSGHKKNMLDKDWEYFGAGFAKDFW
ncbi:5955_t:CDS:2, partial [Cetraspora pellucida]